MLCYDCEPNVMVEPCGHGGVCKTCFVNYIKDSGNKCIFCKTRFNHIYTIQKSPQDGQFYATGEIKFK